MANNNGFVVDISNWKMKQVKAWNRASREGDSEAREEMMMAVIKEWPYPGSITDPEYYDELSPEDYTEAVGQVVDAINERMKRRS
jgi:hypothetical protein